MAIDTDTLSVLVLSRDFIATYPLPDSGDVIVGRSHAAEIYVDDPLVSRKHAVLSTTPRLSIRDLGSANGTSVLGAALSPNEPRLLAVGDVVTIGSAALMIQRGPATLRSRRFWDRRHFEARLAEECARADRTRGQFSLACLHAGRNLPRIQLQQLLAGALRGSDVIGEYGRAVYAILIVDANSAQVEMLKDRITSSLARHDVAARWAFAHYPRDGRTADELLAKVEVGASEPVERAAEARIVGDPATQEVYRMAERIAAGDINVLITGETGVGKEVMAEEIHARSARAPRPLLRLNCAALSESLLESELFGHERGAFTSAIAAKPGLLELADGGSVLLDEIGELPMAMQVKLLRVIEEKRVRRVGGVKATTLDVRFLAATNRDLEELCGRGQFRSDLYYRLAGATLKIPPLRARPGDIEPLVRAFLAQASRHLDGAAPTLSPDALTALRAYRWPGNIRELRHVIERAVLLAGIHAITPAHLPFEPAVAVPDAVRPGPDEPTRTEDPELQHILEVLAACGGNQSRAAKKLGLSRGALIRRLERHGVIRPRKGTN